MFLFTFCHIENTFSRAGENLFISFKHMRRRQRPAIREQQPLDLSPFLCRQPFKDFPLFDLQLASGFIIRRRSRDLGVTSQRLYISPDMDRESSVPTF